jgi:hypothetical protein
MDELPSFVEGVMKQGGEDRRANEDLSSEWCARHSTEPLGNLQQASTRYSE